MFSRMTARTNTSIGTTSVGQIQMARVVFTAFTRAVPTGGGVTGSTVIIIAIAIIIAIIQTAPALITNNKQGGCGCRKIAQAMTLLRVIA